MIMNWQQPGHDERTRRSASRCLRNGTGTGTAGAWLTMKSISVVSFRSDRETDHDFTRPCRRCYAVVGVQQGVRRLGMYLST